MALKRFNIKTPGKLILSGEWAVLNKNNLGIVCPVNRFLETSIEESSEIVLNAKDIKQKKDFFLPEQAIKTTLNYLSEKKINTKNFKITINSQISKIKLKNGDYKKIGLGSSAAVVVGIVSAILKLHEYKIEEKEIKKIIFKLSSIAHFLAQGCLGSCIDIACCTYKKTLAYKRFDSSWLERKIKENKITEILEIEWPNLKIQPLLLPKNLILIAGFVGYSASTKKLILNNLIKEKKETIKKINTVTKQLIEILKQKSSKQQEKETLKLIKQNRILLKALNPKLETKELTTLIEAANKFNAAGKFSGAGGGDCGIAICFDEKEANKIKCEWEQRGLYPLDLEIFRK